MKKQRDHGGGLDAAMARYGGSRDQWLDLSTGINPVPYHVGDIPEHAWSALPDSAAQTRLLTAARRFWNVPKGADVVAANGASALIAKMPYLTNEIGAAYIPTPTYNEHAAAVEASDEWVIGNDPDDAQFHVYVHPNNPDGRLWDARHMGGRALTVIDESFCDVAPDQSHVALSEDPGIVVLKSFGKFWGLAGLRLGFAIGSPSTLAPVETHKVPFKKPTQQRLATLAEHLGPWSVSGPALEIGAQALEDTEWADATRERLARDADRLDALLTKAGATIVGGTTLFRLCEVSDASAVQDHLAKHHIWTRIFPYSQTWVRIGLPHPDRWDQLEHALGTAGGAMVRPRAGTRGD